MRIRLDTFRKSDGTQVVKGWWGSRRIVYRANESSGWMLWVGDEGEKPKWKKRAPDRQGEIDNVYETQLDVALHNIQQVLRYRD